MERARVGVFSTVRAAGSPPATYLQHPAVSALDVSAAWWPACKAKVRAWLDVACIFSSDRTPVCIRSLDAARTFKAR